MDDIDRDVIDVGAWIVSALDEASPARDTAAQWVYGTRGEWSAAYRLLAQLDVAVQALHQAQAVLGEIAPPLLPTEERQPDGGDILSLLMLAAEQEELAAQMAEFSR